MTEDMLSWLRREVEADKAVAEAVRQPDGRPTAAPWTSYAHPPGTGDRYQDRDVILVGAESEDDGASWLVCTAGQWPGARAVADHIALHDPRDTIARCEAELALLDELLPELESAEEVIRAEWNAGPDLSGALIRTLLAAYRHRPGYSPAWAPEGTAS